MRTLLHMAKTLEGLLKDQRPCEDESYRLLHFVVKQPVDDGLLLFNVMTKALVLLDADEACRMEADPASVPGLVEGWFAVPLSHDDVRLAREVRAVGRMLQNHARTLRTYTVLTTTDCNARCFYCYEKGRSRIPMSDETARATAAFIIRNSPGEKVHIRWFGGEPLFNKGVISLICSLLERAGVEFRSSMVSNGFLFDEGTVSEAVRSWRLDEVQITLDGTEKVYNRTKAFVDPVDNPFRRVLGNIRLLADAGVRVNIRLNIGRHNADDLFSLVELLGEEFGSNPKVSVYSHSLFETCTPVKVLYDGDDQRKELSDRQMQLKERLRELGLKRPSKLRRDLKLNRCMADGDDSVVILPDGHVGKCEHYTDSDWFTHVSGAERDEAVINSFKELREDLEPCAECAFYPDCFRLSKCPETLHCYPEEREEKLAGTRLSMISYYERNEVQD